MRDNRNRHLKLRKLFISRYKESFWTCLFANRGATNARNCALCYSW